MDIMKTGESRVFTIEDRANPSHTPKYQGFAKAQNVNWPQGDVTPIRVPDPTAYNQYIIIDEIIGAQGLPEVPIMFRKQREFSDMLRLIRKRCPIDIQVHIGNCKNPSDFLGGWDSIMVIESAHAVNYATSPLGALDSAEQAPVDETLQFKGRDLYEIRPVAGAEIGAATILSEVIAVAICDARSCGACGISSDGVQKLFAITTENSGSPGLASTLVYSPDQGSTVGTSLVTTLAVNKAPSGLACVGTDLCVISSADGSLHYAPTADVLAAIETWTKVTSGFANNKGPAAIFSLGAAFTWFAGLGGYVYFSSDITSGVTVQDAGSATVQNLNDIHGIDELHLIAVGASNALLVTENGGEGWSAVTGPTPGVALNTCWMRSIGCWVIGTAGGECWYTEDSGLTWHKSAFSGSGAGTVKAIRFSTPTVGWMAHATAAPVGRIFRTIDGGHQWYALPEQTGLRLPTNQRIDSIAVSPADPNFALAGGLGTGTDGILMKIA